MQRITRHLDDAKHEMHPGDLLLYRCGWKPSNFLISRIGGSPYVHAAMIDFQDATFCILETLQWHGVRKANLEKQIQQYPGRWDHFIANPYGYYDWDRHKSVEYVRSLLDKKYGWGSLLLATARQVPWVRLLIRPNTDDTLRINGMPPYCSELCARGIQHGGVDPIPNRPNRLVEPGRLAESLFFKYNCTLVP